MKKTISVLVVDDHAITRMGLVSLLGTESDLSVVGQAENGREALAAVAKLAPDVVVMDLMMPEMDGVAATREIVAAHPGSHVLILTTFGTSDDLAHALDAGATGALMKNADPTELIAAIRAVAAGTRTVAPEVEKMLRLNPPAPALTKRQLEVLESVTRGLSNNDMAIQFGITPDCVKEHVNAILRKLGAATRAEAVAIALRKQLLKA